MKERYWRATEPPDPIYRRFIEICGRGARPESEVTASAARAIRPASSSRETTTFRTNLTCDECAGVSTAIFVS